MSLTVASECKTCHSLLLNVKRVTGKNRKINDHVFHRAQVLCVFYKFRSRPVSHTHTHTHTRGTQTPVDTALRYGKEKNRIKLLQLSQCWAIFCVQKSYVEESRSETLVSDWSMYRETCQRGLVSNCSNDRIEHCTYTIFDCGN